jgi:hypothetical protein
VYYFAATAIGIWAHFEPSRLVRNKGAQGCWRIGIGEFFVDREGYQDLLKQLRQHLDCVDQHQVIDRPGIGDNEPHAP